MFTFGVSLCVEHRVRFGHNPVHGADSPEQVSVRCLREALNGLREIITFSSCSPLGTVLFCDLSIMSQSVSLRDVVTLYSLDTSCVDVCFTQRYGYSLQHLPAMSGNERNYTQWIHFSIWARTAWKGRQGGNRIWGGNEKLMQGTEREKREWL